MSVSEGFVVTHVAPREGLQVWREPDPTGPVISQVQGGVQLQLLERRGAWANVAFSNGWSGWVDGRRIVDAAAPAPTPPPSPAPAATPAATQPPASQPQSHSQAQPQPSPEPQPSQPQARPQGQQAQPKPQPQSQPQGQGQQGQPTPQPQTAKLQAPQAGAPNLDKKPGAGGGGGPKQQQSGPKPATKPVGKKAPSPAQAKPQQQQPHQPQPQPRPRQAEPAPAPERSRYDDRDGGLLSRLPTIAGVRIGPALIGAAGVLIGTVLSWIRVQQARSNAYDVPLAFLWNYKAGSDGGLKVGLLLLALAVFVGVFSVMPGQVAARRALGGVAIAVALIYTIQLQRLLSAAGDAAPSLLSAIGFGVLVVIASGVGILIDRSEPGED